MLGEPGQCFWDQPGDEPEQGLPRFIVFRVKATAVNNVGAVVVPIEDAMPLRASPANVLLASLSKASQFLAPTGCFGTGCQRWACVSLSSAHLAFRLSTQEVDA